MAGKLILLKQFGCPQCGAPQQIRAGGFANTFVCSSCLSTIDISDERYAVLRQGSESVFQSRQRIPLGKRGRFFGTKYEVIGFMVRSDRTGIYLWDEYLLFNPYEGFCWLMEMNGHWNFVRMIKERPGSPGANWVSLSGMKFKRFLRDQPRVRFVLGEFYWQVKVEDKVTSYDYISPPYGVSCEVEDGEIVWSTLEYMTSAAVNAGFGGDLSLPWASGIAPTQPGPGRDLGTLVGVGVATIVILILIKSFVTFRAQRLLVVPETYFSYSVADSEKVKKSDIFEIPAAGNLYISATSPVNNSWINLAVDLVNADTQESIEGNLEVAYYNGTDSDGAWTEGSQQTDDVIGAVPPGRYYLAIEPSADPNLSVTPFTLKARYDVPYSGNLIAAMFLVFVLPAISLARRMIFESRRWQESDEA